MVVELREIYYYALQGSSIDPDLSTFGQEVTLYEISGSIDGAQLGDSVQYLNEYNAYAVTGGTVQSDSLYNTMSHLFIIEGVRNGDLIADRTGLFFIESVLPSNILITDPTIYVITS